jgi:hypothetical protein
MTEKDFAVGIAAMPSVGSISKKPCYLIMFEGGSGKKATHFIALDKPDSSNGFVQAKGIYCTGTEDSIRENFTELVASAGKEGISDMMFPWHRIHSIRNLVFNALKPSTLIK